MDPQIPMVMGKGTERHELLLHPQQNESIVPVSSSDCSLITLQTLDKTSMAFS